MLCEQVATLFVAFSLGFSATANAYIAFSSCSSLQRQCQQQYQQQQQQQQCTPTTSIQRKSATHSTKSMIPLPMTSSFSNAQCDYRNKETNRNDGNTVVAVFPKWQERSKLHFWRRRRRHSNVSNDSNNNNNNNIKSNINGCSRNLYHHRSRDEKTALSILQGSMDPNNNMNHGIIPSTGTNTNNNSGGSGSCSSSCSTTIRRSAALLASLLTIEDPLQVREESEEEEEEEEELSSISTKLEDDEKESQSSSSRIVQVLPPINPPPLELLSHSKSRSMMTMNDNVAQDTSSSIGIDINDDYYTNSASLVRNTNPNNNNNNNNNNAIRLYDPQYDDIMIEQLHQEILDVIQVHNDKNHNTNDRKDDSTMNSIIMNKNAEVKGQKMEFIKGMEPTMDSRYYISTRSTGNSNGTPSGTIENDQEDELEDHDETGTGTTTMDRPFFVANAVQLLQQQKGVVLPPMLRRTTSVRSTSSVSQSFPVTDKNSMKDHPLSLVYNNDNSRSTIRSDSAKNNSEDDDDSDGEDDDDDNDNDDKTSSAIFVSDLILPSRKLLLMKRATSANGISQQEQKAYEGNVTLQALPTLGKTTLEEVNASLKEIMLSQAEKLSNQSNNLTIVETDLSQQEVVEKAEKTANTFAKANDLSSEAPSKMKQGKTMPNRSTKSEPKAEDVRQQKNGLLTFFKSVTLPRRKSLHPIGSTTSSNIILSKKTDKHKVEMQPQSTIAGVNKEQSEFLANFLKNVQQEWNRLGTGGYITKEVKLKEDNSNNDKATNKLEPKVEDIDSSWFSLEVKPGVDDEAIRGAIVLANVFAVVGMITPIANFGDSSSITTNFLYTSFVVTIIASFVTVTRGMIGDASRIFGTLTWKLFLVSFLLFRDESNSSRKQTDASSSESSSAEVNKFLPETIARNVDGLVIDKAESIHIDEVGFNYQEANARTNSHKTDKTKGTHTVEKGILTFTKFVREFVDKTDERIIRTVIRPRAAERKEQFQRRLLQATFQYNMSTTKKSLPKRQRNEVITTLSEDSIITKDNSAAEFTATTLTSSKDAEVTNKSNQKRRFGFPFLNPKSGRVSTNETDSFSSNISDKHEEQFRQLQIQTSLNSEYDKVILDHDGSIDSESTATCAETVIIEAPTDVNEVSDIRNSSGDDAIDLPELFKYKWIRDEDKGLEFRFDQDPFVQQALGMTLNQLNKGTDFVRSFIERNDNRLIRSIIHRRSSERRERFQRRLLQSTIQYKQKVKVTQNTNNRNLMLLQQTSEINTNRVNEIPSRPIVVDNVNIDIQDNFVVPKSLEVIDVGEEPIIVSESVTAEHESTHFSIMTKKTNSVQSIVFQDNYTVADTMTLEISERKQEGMVFFDESGSPDGTVLEEASALFDTANEDFKSAISGNYPSVLQEMNHEDANGTFSFLRKQRVETMPGENQISLTSITNNTTNMVDGCVTADFALKVENKLRTTRTPIERLAMVLLAASAPLLVDYLDRRKKSNEC